MLEITDKDIKETLDDQGFKYEHTPIKINWNNIYVLNK